MLRCAGRVRLASSIAWPTDAALLPGKKLAPPLPSSSSSSLSTATSDVAPTPLTRAKARWLLHRGAADAEVACVAVQTTATWAAACNVIAWLTERETRNVDRHAAAAASISLSSPSPSTSALSPQVMEALAVRLVQELRLHGAQLSGVVGGAHNLHRRQVYEALNAVAAVEVDLEPPGQHFSDAVAKEAPHNISNEAEDAAVAVDAPEDGDASSKGAKSTGDGFDDRAEPFATRLALGTTGTLSLHRGDVLCRDVLDFCKARSVPATPQLLSTLSLLAHNWADALHLVRRADRILDSGAPLPVLESAMRCCVASGDVNVPRTWAHALGLYNVAASRFGASAVAASPVAISYALHALSAMQIAAAFDHGRSVHPADAGGDHHHHRRAGDELCWLWSLRLFHDAAAVSERNRFFLRGDAGAALCSAAVSAAGLSRNWALALSVLSNKCDTQIGSMVDADDDESLAGGAEREKKMLLIPDADALFSALTACVSCGRYKEAERVAALMFAAPSAEPPGFGYTIVDVSGRLLDHCVKLLFSKFHRAFSARLLARRFASAHVLELQRRLLTPRHCTALAQAARSIALAATAPSSADNNGVKDHSRNMWQLASVAFAEYVQLMPSISPRIAMLFGGAVISDADAMNRLVLYLAQDGVVNAVDDSRTAAAAADADEHSGDDPDADDAAAAARYGRLPVVGHEALPLLACTFHSMRNNWHSALSLAMSFFDAHKSGNNDNNNNNSNTSAHPQQREQRAQLSKSVLVACQRLLHVMLRTRGVHWAAALHVAAGMDAYDSRIRQHHRALNETILEASLLRSKRLRASDSDNGEAEEDVDVGVSSSAADPKHTWRIALRLYAECDVDKKQKSGGGRNDLRQKMRRFIVRTGHFNTAAQVDALLSEQTRGAAAQGQQQSAPAAPKSGKTLLRRGVGLFDRTF